MGLVGVEPILRTTINYKMGNRALIDGLEQARTLAVERAGTLLSPKYKTARTPMLWQCGNNHTWNACLSDIKKGTWCPQCNTSLREHICRAVLEVLTRHTFPKARPAWLVNNKGNRMELDGYCKELNLAFEHQGQQHYKFLPRFHKNVEEFQQQRINDEIKRTLCNNHHVHLIEIHHTVPSEQLKNWITNYLTTFCSALTLHTSDNVIINPNALELSELHLLAQVNGGKCLSNSYLGSTAKHDFQCSQNHTWATTIGNIRRGTWCPVCKPKRIANSKRKHSVCSMQQLAQARGGKFLSTIFESVNEKYEWSCKDSHVWSTPATEIQKGSWCPTCARLAQKHALKNLSDLAKSRGGQCLSTVYLNSYTQYLWKCTDGHTWMARYNNVKNCKSWCPVCPKSKNNEARGLLSYKTNLKRNKAA